MIIAVSLPTNQGTNVNHYEQTSDGNKIAQEDDLGANIIWPRISSPAIVLNDSTLQARIKAPSNLTNWNLTLYQPYYGYSLSITDSEWNDSTSIWAINASIPSNAIKGLFDLVVRATDSIHPIEITQFNAVQIRYSYPENFSMHHVTDPHIKVSSSPRDERLLSSLYQASISGVDFVVLSGDLVETGYKESFERLASILKQSRVPVFVGPGNHDIDSDGSGFDEYSSIFGPDYYTASIGPDILLVMGNSHLGELNTTQIQWIERDLSQSDAKTKILCIHHPLYDLNEPPNYYLEDDEAVTLVDICEENDVDIVLTGHLHNDRVDRVNGTPWAVTAAIGAPVSTIPSEPEHLVHGFRIIEFRDHVLFSWNWTPQKDWSQPWDGVTLKRVPRFYRELDVGAFIELSNGMNYSLENQVLDVLVQPPSEEQDYLVSGGDSVGRASSSDAYRFRFEFDLPAGGSETLRVYPDNAQQPELVNVTYPEEVNVGNEYTVSAEWSNPVSGVVEGYLNYSLDNGSFAYVEMAECGNNKFCCNLEHDTSGQVEFQVIGVDYAGNEAVSEVYSLECVSPEPTGGPQGFNIIQIGLALGGVIVIAGVAFYILRTRGTTLSS
jgi:predicted phosphodiesterase